MDASTVMTPINSRASVHLEMLRAVSAIAVFLGHLRALMFVDYQPGSELLTAAFYFLTGFGHQAVLVFFILSGLLIAQSVLSAHARKELDWGAYFLRRTSRIYIVLVPCLLLGAFWDHLGTLLFSGPNGIYGGDFKGAALGTLDLSRDGTPGVLLANLVSLQDFRAPAFGSNKPLWSLSHEFWFYVLFPLLFVASGPGQSLLRRILTLCAAGLILILTGPKILAGFALWSLGALVAWSRDLLPRLGERAACGIVAASSAGLACTLVLERFRRLPEWLGVAGRDGVVGLSFALLLTAILLLPPREKPPDVRYSAAVNSLSGFSFTLYLAHFPVLVFIQAALVGEQRWELGTGSLMGAGCIALAVGLYAYFLARVTEARTNEFRRWLKAMLIDKGILGTRIAR